MSQSSLSIAHFGLRARNLADAIAWYGTAFGASVLFRNDLAAFMSFDDEHHRFVLWDDGATEARSDNAGGVDHIGFGCESLGALADEYERLRDLGIEPTLAVNHGFTCSLYYRDPDGNEVELTADNFPTKAQCKAFMAGESMRRAMAPPFFGARFDPEDFARLRQAGASEAELARIGL